MKKLFSIILLCVAAFDTTAQSLSKPYTYGLSTARGKFTEFAGLPVLEDTVCNLVVNNANGTCEGATIWVRAEGSDSLHLWVRTAVRWIRGGASAAVQSVNGKVGTVELNTDDIAEGVAQYFTTARARAAFTAGTGISIVNGNVSNTAPDQTITFVNGSGATVTGTYPGPFTVSATGSGGTLQSVGLTMPSIFGVSGSPVTGTSGTLGVTLNSQAANLVFQSPNGVSGVPTFRALAAADIPLLTTGKISDFNTAVQGVGDARYVPLTRTVTTSGIGITGGGALSANQNISLNLSELDDRYLSGYKQRGAVRAATTSNITLSGLQTIDGVTLVANDRVLVKNQTTAADNGIRVAAAGAWARAADFDQAVSGEIEQGAQIFVEQGTTQAKTGWSLSTPSPITVGTTALNFTQYAGANNYMAGTGLNLVGNVFSAQNTTAQWDANRIQGVGVDAAAPSIGDFYRYNGTSWQHVPLAAGDIPVLDVAKITTGTFPIARGGTGLSSLGSANQLLRVNSGATALEYFTPTYISGNQNITLSGDVTGSGATAITTTVSAAAVRDKVSAGTGLSYNSATGVFTNTAPNTVPSLAQVLGVGNTSASAGITLGGSGVTSFIPYQAIRNVSSTNYTLSLGVGPTANSVLAIGNGTTSQDKWLSLPHGGTTVRYSPNGGTSIYDIWHSNNHPAGNSLAPALTGANVLASLTTNAAGHVTGATTRALTPADIGAASASLPLSTVLANGNTANSNISIGANGNVNQYAYQATRNVGGTNYTATFAVAGGGTPGAYIGSSDGSGTNTKLLYVPYNFNAPRYSPDGGSNSYEMWHSNNHPAGGPANNATFSGASVPALIANNAAGHITSVTSRILTPADIGAAPAAASANYIQNTVSPQAGSNFYISGSGISTGLFQVRKDGSNSVAASLQLSNSTFNRGVNFQLNGDATPGLSTWIHNGTSWIKRQEQNATNGMLTISADGGEGIELYRAISVAGSATGSVLFSAVNSAGDKEPFARIWGVAANTTDGAEAGDIQFLTRQASGLVNRMSLFSDGTLSKFGTLGTISLAASGAEQTFSRSGANFIRASATGGYFNIITGGGGSTDAESALTLAANNSATFRGAVTLANIPAMGTAATTFLASNSGVVSSRTAAQVLSDIGAAPAGEFVSRVASTSNPANAAPFTGNIDNVTNTSISYVGPTATNAPVSYPGYLINAGNNGSSTTYKFQMYGAVTSNDELFYRQGIAGGAWGGWNRVASHDFVNNNFAPISNSVNYIRNVSSGAQAANFRLSGYGMLQRTPSDTYSDHLVLQDNLGYGANFQMSTQGALTLWMGDEADKTRKLTVSADGKVGILKNNPLVELDVEGDAAVSGTVIAATVSANTVDGNSIIGDGYTAGIRVITSSITVSPSDYTIVNAATTAGPTITLPAANISKGRIIVLVDEPLTNPTANQMNWFPAISFKGSNLTSFNNPSLAAYSRITIQSDGTVWRVISGM